MAHWRAGHAGIRAGRRFWEACLTCGGILAPHSRSMCARHLTAARRRRRVLSLARVSTGRCIRCNRPREVERLSQCASCRATQRARDARKRTSIPPSAVHAPAGGDLTVAGIGRPPRERSSRRGALSGSGVEFRLAVQNETPRRINRGVLRSAGCGRHPNLASNNRQYYLKTSHPRKPTRCTLSASVRLPAAAPSDRYRLASRRGVWTIGISDRSSTPNAAATKFGQRGAGRPCGLTGLELSVAYYAQFQLSKREPCDVRVICGETTATRAYGMGTTATRPKVSGALTRLESKGVMAILTGAGPTAGMCSLASCRIHAYCP